VKEDGKWSIAGIDVTAHEGQGGTAVGFVSETVSNETVRGK